MQTYRTMKKHKESPPSKDELRQQKILAIRAELERKLAAKITNQSDVARATGISQSLISSALSGKRRLYWDQVVEIAAFEQIDMNWLASESTGVTTPGDITDEEYELIKLARLVGDIEVAKKRLVQAAPRGGGGSNKPEGGHRYLKGGSSRAKPSVDPDSGGDDQIIGRPLRDGPGCRVS